MEIRAELPEDRDAIAEVVRTAFLGQHEGAEPVEMALIDALRADEAWIPELSLVAVLDGRIVGHVVATRGQLAGRPALGVGPLAVHPDHQRKGIGSALMTALAERSDAPGDALSALLGEPDYYSRFGYVMAATMNVAPPIQEWVSHFQVRVPPGVTSPTGTFEYPAPFMAL